jgi:hypothetical protein
MFGQQLLQALLGGLQDLGWTVGSNLEVDVRFGSSNDTKRIQDVAKGLVATQPELIQVVIGT